MFTATYPASLIREQDGHGFHVRFPDLPEALTGGADLDNTLVEAADCLAEAIAGRIARGDEIPRPSKPKRGQHLINVPLYLARKLALYLAMRERGLRIPTWHDVSACVKRWSAGCSTQSTRQKARRFRQRYRPS